MLRLSRGLGQITLDQDLVLNGGGIKAFGQVDRDFVISRCAVGDVIEDPAVVRGNHFAGGLGGDDDDDDWGSGSGSGSGGGGKGKGKKPKKKFRKHPKDKKKYKNGLS